MVLWFYGGGSGSGIRDTNGFECDTHMGGKDARHKRKDRTNEETDSKRQKWLISIEMAMNDDDERRGFLLLLLVLESSHCVSLQLTSDLLLGISLTKGPPASGLPIAKHHPLFI